MLMMMIMVMMMLMNLDRDSKDMMRNLHIRLSTRTILKYTFYFIRKKIESEELEEYAFPTEHLRFFLL